MKKIILNKSGLDYISDNLSDGHALMNIVGESLDLSKGTAFTFLPDSTDIHSAMEFRYGGKLPQPPISEWQAFIDNDGMKRIAKPVPNLHSELICFIENALKDLDCVFLTEDFLASKEDLTHALSIREDVHFYGQEVYYSIIGQKITPESAKEILRYSWSSPHAVGIFSTVEHSVLLHKHLTLKNLYQIAEGTIGIVAYAYDGEGFVIWASDVLFSKAEFYFNVRQG